MNKRGISGIIAAVIMIALVFAAGVIVWVVVNNLVESKLEGVGSCIDVYEKVELNGLYTCFDNTNNRVVFSVTRKDIDITGLVVLVTGQGKTKSIPLNETEMTIANLKYYSNSAATKFAMPDKNEGITYNLSVEFTSAPASIEVSPIVGEKQCEATDEISPVPFCNELWG